MSCVLVPALAAGQRGSVEFRQRVISLWYRTACRIAGLRVRVYGTPVHGPGNLFAANHVSYLDIVALAAQVDARFVAKREVADWPVIGPIARLTGTIFVERAARQADAQIDAIKDALAGGESVVVFPEGTSTEGDKVLPFKSSLFQAAIARSREAPVRVQPVTVSYRCDHRGVPLTPEESEVYPWVGDAEFVPHLASVLMRPGVEIALSFKPAVSAADFADRKVLADHCQRECADSLTRLIAKARARLPVARRRFDRGLLRGRNLEDIPYFASFD